MSASVLPEHEVLIYDRVNARLDRLDEGMPMKTRGPLIDALHKLSNSPFISFPLEDAFHNPIIIEDEEAGTLGQPDVDVILKHSKPSPFGRGNQTVMDETYRRGREVSAADIELYDYSATLDMENVVNAALFLPRRAELKLYKLALYSPGGHFDWHRDTTHSDRHHGTVLVALNTSWTGGDLILRRDGVEMRADMKPKITDPKRNNGILAAVAFYTDTEHKVEPVSDGMRIVLQYDVLVRGWLDKDQEHKKNQDEDEDTQHAMESDSGGSESGDDYYDDIKELDPIKESYRGRQDLQPWDETGDPAILDEIVKIIGNLLKPGSEVAFALHYLYRKSCILPEFLKGSDSLLYETLSKTFDVSLHPVLLNEVKIYEEREYINPIFLAYKFDQSKIESNEKDGIASYDDDVDVDEEEEEEENNRGFDEEKGKEKEKEEKKIRTTFYVPASSALIQISHPGRTEFTGNESMVDDDKYFGGGMFVRRKGEKATEGA